MSKTHLEIFTHPEKAEALVADMGGDSIQTIATFTGPDAEANAQAFVNSKAAIDLLEQLAGELRVVYCSDRRRPTQWFKLRLDRVNKVLKQVGGKEG